jgi:hypothetical protein
MDTMIANLTQRLEGLERDNRRLKRMARLSGVVIAALMLTGQLTAGSRVIEAERFVLRDVAGRLRADLSMDPKHGPGLRLYDQAGKRRAELMVWAEGGDPTLHLNGPDEHPQAIVHGAGVILNGSTSSADLSAGPNYASLRLGTAASKTDLTLGSGYSHLTFSDTAGAPDRISLGWGIGTTGLRLRDAKGRGEVTAEVDDHDGIPCIAIGTIATGCIAIGEGIPGPEPTQMVLSLRSNGKPTLSLFDTDEHRGAVLAISDEGSPLLALLDKSDRQRLTLAVGQDAAPRVLLHDQDGKLRGSLGLQPDGSPRLALLGPDGKDLAVVPGATLRGDTWVLWRQIITAYPGGQLAKLSLAVSAWPNQSDCQRERVREQASLGKPLVTEAGGVGVLLTCLPGSVNLSDRP